jgi:hypothetical protein
MYIIVSNQPVVVVDGGLFGLFLRGVRGVSAR